MALKIWVRVRHIDKINISAVQLICMLYIIKSILVYFETLGRHGDNVMKVKVSQISSILLNPIVTKSISPRPYNHSKTIINSKSNMTVEDDRFEGEDDGPNSRIKDPNIFSKKSNKVITAAMQSEEEYENKVLLSPTLLQRQRLIKIKDISTKKVSSAIHLLDMLSGYQGRSS